MFESFVNKFYPDLAKDEARKFALLGLLFLIILSSYWLLRLLKNTFFFTGAFPVEFGWVKNQGTLFQPIAKMGSFFVLFILVLIYSRLVDKVKKQQLFYIICSVYAVLFAIVGLIILCKDWAGPGIIGKYTLAVTGWASYFIVESFGSLTAALFWSFTNSITDTESAKKGFPLIIVIGQSGAMFGSGTLFFSDQMGSMGLIWLGSAFLILLVIPMVRYFMRTTPKELLVGYKPVERKQKKQHGFFRSISAGITLLATRPYLLGVFVISTAYEAVTQIVEFQMNSKAAATAAWSASHDFAKFQSLYGVSINFISVLITLLGTRYILKRFGIRVSILIYPVVFGIVLLAVYGFSTLPHTDTQLLWVAFSAMIIAKSLGYALNNPTKEMMYIPTSKDARFKTKGFIDTVGARGAKFGGASVNNVFKHNLNELMVYGTLFGLSLIFIWTIAAFFVGKKNQQLVKEGQIVE